MEGRVCLYRGWGESRSIVVSACHSWYCSPVVVLSFRMNNCKSAFTPCCLCLYSTVCIALWPVEFTFSWARGEIILLLVFAGHYNRCYPLPVRFHGHSLQTLPVPQPVLGSLLAVLSDAATGHAPWAQGPASLLTLLVFMGVNRECNKDHNSDSSSYLEYEKWNLESRARYL